MLDPRFGLTGESEPSVCAVSGEPITGRHANTQSIGDGGFYRVLAKHARQLTPDKQAELEAAFKALTSPAADDTTSKKGKQS